MKALLALKARYKEVAGKEWKPQADHSPGPQQTTKEHKTLENEKEKLTVVPPKMSVANTHPDAVELKGKVDAQGEKVRQLKTGGGASADVEKEVKILLELKKQYKELTGEDLVGGKAKSAKKDKKQDVKATPPSAKLNKAVEPPSSVAKPENVNPNLKKVTRLGLEASKEENFSDWYSQAR